MLLLTYEMAGGEKCDEGVCVGGSPDLVDEQAAGEIVADYIVTRRPLITDPPPTSSTPLLFV